MTRHWIEDLDELAGLDMRIPRAGSNVASERDAPQPRSLKRLSSAVQRLVGRHPGVSERLPGMQDAHRRGTGSHRP